MGRYLETAWTDGPNTFGPSERTEASFLQPDATSSKAWGMILSNTLFCP